MAAEETDRLSAARNALATALRATRDGLSGDPLGWVDEVLGHLREAPAIGRTQTPPRERLARWMAAYPEGDEERCARLSFLLSRAAGELAPAGRVPPRGARADAWQATLATIACLSEGDPGLYRLGRTALIDGERLRALVSESQTQPRLASASFAYAEPGPALRELAVDHSLQAAVSAAVGFPVAPIYRADYLYYEGPGAHLPPHLDGGPYEIVFLLTLERVAPAEGSERSALLVYLPGKPPTRAVLELGEAVVLRGRHVFHAREPVKVGERLTIALIGFRRR